MRIALFLIYIFGCQGIFAQAGYIKETPWVDHLIDRLQTSGQDLDIHTSVRSYPILSLVQDNVHMDSLTSVDHWDYQRLHSSLPEEQHLLRHTTNNQPSKQGFFKNFYKDQYSFWVLDTEDFFLKVDPAFHFSVGDNQGQNGLMFQNTRGISVCGIIDKRVYFFTSLLETQKSYLNYENDEISRLNAIPGQSFYKRYSENIFGGLRGWDHLNAQAYVGGKISKSIDIQFGHGRHFIGDGIRSMLLSDYATNYLYLQFNTKVWKFHYQNTFAELSANSSADNPGDELLPKKYMATHYLDFKPSPRFSIGLFESIVFGRTNHFELQYLNPVILYRSLERSLNSPDNAFVGLNAKWIPIDHLQLYGQVMLDELRVSELFSNNGWWGNKVGYQIGLKKFDLFGINSFDLQAEYNSARPYTYTHRGTQVNGKPIASYSHYNQALAHPLGANFSEMILRLKYRPVEKLFLESTFYKANYGTLPLQNAGRDILISYDDRLGDFDQQTGQGLANDIRAIYFTASWELMHQYYIDLNVVVRNRDLDGSRKRDTRYIGLGFRANVFDSPLLF